MNLLIYGAGGLALDIIDMAQRINKEQNRWRDVILLDDFNPNREYYNHKVINFEEALQYKNEAEMIIGLGEPIYREQLYNKCIEAGFHIISLIDPSAIVSECVSIGQGTIVLAYGYIVGNAQIGNNVVMMSRVIIGHDTVIGNHSVIGSVVPLGGGTIVGQRVYVANGSTVRDQLTIGDDSVIGMGSVVFSDVPEGMVVLGNPGRIIRRNEDHRIFGDKK